MSFDEPTLPRLSLRGARAVRWAVPALCGFAALAAFVTLWWPLGYDQAIFALNGATVRAGGMPYRDAFETRGPLAFYLYAALELVHGGSAVTVRAFDLALLPAGLAIVWRVVAPVGGRRAAAAAAALWTLYVVSTGYFNMAQPDLWVAYAVVGAALLGARAGGVRARDLVLAGALVGLCAITKPFYLVFLAAPWAAASVTHRGRPADLARTAALLAAGCAVPVAAACAVLWGTGAWASFVAVHFQYNLAIYAHMFRKPTTAGEVLSQLATVGRQEPSVLKLEDVYPAAAAGLWMLWRAERLRPLAAALMVSAAAGVFCVVLQGKYFFYQWFPVLFVLALLSAVGFAALLGARPVAGASAGTPGGTMPAAVRIWAVVSLLVLAGVIAARPSLYVRQWVAYMRGAKTADDYYALFHEGREINPADERRAVEYVAARTRPGTVIAQWGIDAAVPYLARRPIVGPFPVTRALWIAPDAPVTRAYQEAYVRAFVAARPPYVVRGLQGVRSHSALPIRLDSLLPPIADELARHYVLDWQMGDLNIYRRVGYVPPGTVPPADASRTGPVARRVRGRASEPLR